MSRNRLSIKMFHRVNKETLQFNLAQIPEMIVPPAFVNYALKRLNLTKIRTF